MASENTNHLEIKSGERLFLNGKEVKAVSDYVLKHSADKCAAELTITMMVSVNQTDFE